MREQLVRCKGKVIVTCSLPLNEDNTELVVAHTSSGAEELAKKMIPQARVASAFHTVPSEVLFGVHEAKRHASRLSLVYYGDDHRAKELAAQLIRDAGFDPVDAGPLRLLRRAVRAAGRPTGLRGKRGPGAGLPVRVVGAKRMTN